MKIEEVMFHNTFVIITLLFLPLIQAKTESIALKRQTLIYHEPPFENNLERADTVTEHYITQRLDNFNNQDHRTFQMVLAL